MILFKKPVFSGVAWPVIVALPWGKGIPALKSPGQSYSQTFSFKQNA